MTHGFDTSFLIAAEVDSHPNHAAARARLLGFRQAGDDFALAPQVLAEFIHVVTDPRRFSAPLDMNAALARANAWWTSPEVNQVLPNTQTVKEFFHWMATHRLGRKRILDTLLAATYWSAGIASLLTIDDRDFAIFGTFQLVKP